MHQCASWQQLGVVLCVGAGYACRWCATVCVAAYVRERGALREMADDGVMAVTREMRRMLRGRDAVAVFGVWAPVSLLRPAWATHGHPRASADLLEMNEGQACRGPCPWY